MDYSEPTGADDSPEQNVQNAARPPLETAEGRNNPVAGVTELHAMHVKDVATPLAKEDISSSSSPPSDVLENLHTGKTTTTTTNQFQRSGSLRMSGTKSFLPLNDTSYDGFARNKTKMESYENTNTITTSNNNNSSNHRSTHTHYHNANELTPTGRISPRRKLLLTSFNPNGVSVNLRRSLSLQRSYKHGYNKTDSAKAKCIGGCVMENQKDSPITDPPNIKSDISSGQGCKKPLKEARHMSLSLNGSTTKSIGTATISPRGQTTTSKSASLASPISTDRDIGGAIGDLNISPNDPKLTPRTPPVTPDSPSTFLDDDLDSMYSFATTTSGRSTMSCEHPYVARNGTTFSGRKMKYVVHCSSHAGQVGADYLTPTQRAQRQIRRLKELLYIARQDLEQKDSEIVRLTREVVELRLFKASLSSPEERSASSDAVTVREAELKTSQDVSPIVDTVDEGNKSSPRHHHQQQQQEQQDHQEHQEQPGQQPHLQQQHLLHGPINEMQISLEMQSSYADSGHFEDMTSSSVHSKDSYGAGHAQDVMPCPDDERNNSSQGVSTLENYELQRQELIRMYEQRIEDLIRNQDVAASEMKRNHNDRVEALLQKLAECNTRYADIVPDYEHAKERIRELEKQLDELQGKLMEQEDKQKKMYLHMYQQGQEAERIARADQALELAHRAPDSKVSLNELLQQLQSTQDELENIRAAEYRIESGSNHALLTAKEAVSLWILGARKTIYRRLLEAQKNRTRVDPEVTLQFLKSAIYYFLTDKENSHGHLQAIESILEFTEAEKQNISKAHPPKPK